jgi:predicted nucleic acid-binding protein
MIRLAIDWAIVRYSWRHCSHYADIVATVRRRGRPMSALDVQIAAICRQHDATLATRKVTDFEAVKLPVVDPWAQPED